MGLKNIGIEPPLFLMVTFLGVSGYGMIARDDEGIIRILGERIDRNNLTLPEIALDSFDVDPSKVMRPIFDSVWNACGRRGSQNYDNDGNWRINR